MGPWVRSACLEAFPAAPERTEQQIDRVLIASSYAVAFLLGAGVLLLRQTGVVATNTIWAEDGSVFLHDALAKPFGSSVLHLYAGYVQLLPRMLVEVPAALPLRDASATISVSGAAVVAALALVVFRASAGHVQCLPLRAILAAAVVLLPVALTELVANLVDLSWFCLFATFWVLLWRPSGWAGRVVAFAVCFSTAGSSLVALLLLPIAAMRIVALRRVREHLATAGLLAGLALQAAGIGLAGGTGVAAGHGPVGSVARAMSLRVGLGWLTGRHLTQVLFDHYAYMPVIASCVLLGALVVTALSIGDLRVRVMVVTGTVTAAVMFGVPVYLRWGTLFSWSVVGKIDVGARYAVPSILIVASVMLIALDATVRDNARAVPWAVLVALAVSVPIWTVDYRYTNGRTDGPRWDQQVRVAEATCRAPLDVTRQATVALSPPPNWSTQIPCSSLGSDGTVAARPPRVLARPPPRGGPA